MGRSGVWWLGQSSLVLKAAGTTIYVDPYLQSSSRRLVPPAFPPEAVDNADLVLLTHDHLDHIDPTALPGIALASPGSAVRHAAPDGRAGRGSRRRRRARGGSRGWRTPDARPAWRLCRWRRSTRNSTSTRRSATPNLGYVLRLGGLTIYNAGDTIPYEGVSRGPCNHSPSTSPSCRFNGRDFFRTSAGTIGNCDYREAAELATAIGVDTARAGPTMACSPGTPSRPATSSATWPTAPHTSSRTWLGRYGLFIYQRP